MLSTEVNRVIHPMHNKFCFLSFQIEDNEKFSF